MKTIKTLLLFFAIGWGIGLQAQVACGITQPYFYSTVNPNGLYTFHDTSTYAAGWLPTSYLWDFGDGSTSTLASPSHVYATPGNYNVCMTVTAQLQGSNIFCSATYCKTYNLCLGMVQAAFSYSQQGNGVVSFTGTGSSNSPPLSYYWDFGDSTYGTALNPTHTYINTGSYHVCLTVTDANGCTASYCQNIGITSAVCGNLSANFSTTNPTQSAVVLTSTTTGSNTNTLYQWWMDGVQLSNPNPNTSFTTTNVTTGYHTFCLYVYSNANTFCDSICKYIYVQNGLNPCGNVQANFTFTTSNGTIAVQSNSTGVPSGASYQWYLSSTNGVSQSTGLAPTFASYTWSSLPSGVYNVCLYVWSSNQQWCDSTCQTISVTNSNPCLGLSSQFTQNHQGNTYTFTAAANNVNVIHTWKVNGVAFATTPTATYTFQSFPNTTTYLVCHYVTIPGSVCLDSTCTAIVIQGNSGNPCSNFATSFTQATGPNGGIVLSAVSTGGTQPYVYAWSTGATSASITLTTLNGGLYCVTAYDNNQCSAQFCDSVGGNTPCNLNVSIIPQSTGTVAILQAVVTGGVSPYTYVWSNNASTANLLTVNQPGVYCVTASSSNGCVGSACFTYNVNVPATDTICGTVFNDLNGNGIQDPGENGISGYIQIGNFSVYTDSFGHYSAPVPAGSYNVYYCAPTGYTYTVPVTPSSNALNNCSHYSVVATGGGTLCGYNFGVQNTSVTICGTIFFDANNNGTQDAGENGINAVHVYVNGGGTTHHAYTSNTGQYCINLPAGTYTIYISSSSFQTCVTTPQTMSVAATVAGQNYSNNNFAIYCQPGVCNLSVTVTPHTTVTAGFPAWYDVQVCNVGASVASGTANFFYDQAMTFNHSSPVQSSHNASTRTVSWSVNNLLPGNCAYYWVTFDALTNIQLNQFVFTLVNVTPSNGCNDVNMTNNVDTLHQAVTGSWDPNNKLAYVTNTEDNPAQHLISSIEPNQRIEYVVNFQNTGTAPAINVVILDEIAAELDANSFEMIGSSHPCVVTRNGNQLNVQFPQIMLPDSTSDEVNSHGFVKFAVNAVNNLPAGTLILDDAAIYFDYNAPVVTNPSEVLLIEPNGIKDLATATTVVVAPNPMNQYAEIRVKGNYAGFRFVVTDLSGRIVADSQTENSALLFERNNLSAGIYTYQVMQSGKVSAKGKLVIQ